MSRLYCVTNVVRGARGAPGTRARRGSPLGCFLLGWPLQAVQKIVTRIGMHAGCWFGGGGALLWGCFAGLKLPRWCCCIMVVVVMMMPYSKTPCAGESQGAGSPL